MNHQQKPSDKPDDFGSANLITRRGSQFTTTAMVLGLSTVYAVVRYNFFSDVSTQNIPVRRTNEIRISLNIN